MIETTHHQWWKSPTTPWGQAHSSRTYAAGVIHHDTSSHGGFELSADRQAEMPAALRNIHPFAGDGWYEEDCDWCIVALAFPGLFADLSLFNAVRTFRSSHATHAAWLDGPEAASVVGRVEDFRIANAKLFIAGCSSSSGTGWSVHFTSIDGTLQAVATGLTSDEAFQAGPLDVATFGDRVRISATSNAT